MSNVLPLPPNAPPANTPPWLRRLAERLLSISGWKMVGEWPDLKKMVVVGAPHSSAWDAIHGLIAKVAMDLHIVFMGKQEVFFWPLGSLPSRPTAYSIATKPWITRPPNGPATSAARSRLAFLDIP